MAGKKNKKQKKQLAEFLRSRRKDMEIKALLTDSPVAASLAKYYAKAEQDAKMPGRNNHEA